MIPPVAHFVWYGQTLPWVYAQAVRSAAVRGGFARVVLHHRDELSHCTVWPDLLRLPNFEARFLEEKNILRKAGGGELAGFADEPLSFPARSNLVRAALLYTEGGVYLDTDTVTVRSLTGLREASTAFLGLERIVFPHWVCRSRNPLVLIKAGLKDATRYVFRLLPYGYLFFPRLAPWYHLAANNAVLAAQPGHPFLASLLAAMVQVPEKQRRVPYALGTHILQSTLEQYSGRDVQTYGPEYFFPLGPQISQHWFRRGNKRPLEEVIGAETRVVHWYASDVNKSLIRRIDADYVKTNASHQLFSKLLLLLLDS